MILRFEDEYPECRLPAPPPAPSTGTTAAQPATTTSSTPGDPSPPTTSFPALSPHSSSTSSVTGPAANARPELSRHGSDLSLSSRTQLFEEGRMHKFGQQVRRDILRPQQEDHAHGTTGHEEEAAHLRLLREKLEGLESASIRDMVVTKGGDEVLEELGRWADDEGGRGGSASAKGG